MPGAMQPTRMPWGASSRAQVSCGLDRFAVRMDEVPAEGPQRAENKLLAPTLESGDRQGLSERTLDEAKALARLSHPNIITVHDVGLERLPGHAEPVLFIAMVAGPQ